MVLVAGVTVRRRANGWTSSCSRHRCQDRGSCRPRCTCCSARRSRTKVFGPSPAVPVLPSEAGCPHQGGSVRPSPSGHRAGVSSSSGCRWTGCLRSPEWRRPHRSSPLTTSCRCRADAGCESCPIGWFPRARGLIGRRIRSQSGQRAAACGPRVLGAVCSLRRSSSPKGDMRQATWAALRRGWSGAAERVRRSFAGDETCAQPG
jgi:hypothetical protein